MRDYEELVKALRTCKLSIPCTECPFYSNGDEPSKECATMNVAAADAIEELLAENKEILYRVEIAENMIAFYQEGKPLPNVPHWISVEERLPEKHVEVLICTEDYGKNELGFVNTAVWDGSEWIEAWNRKESIPYVSNWMLLPEPPKEETE